MPLLNPHLPHSNLLAGSIETMLTILVPAGGLTVLLRFRHRARRNAN